MEHVPVLSACYWGSVEHYRLLARHPKVIIDTGEHYVRQSYRSRTRIVGPNGVQDLSVQVLHGQGQKIPMHEVRLSHAETWARQHVHAFRSAYGKTPWAIHFLDDIEALLAVRHEKLVELDLATMRLAMRWLGLRNELVVSDTYVEVEAGDRHVTSEGESTRPSPRTRTYADLRTRFHPKKPLPPEVDPVTPYTQVFADRHGFQARMSIIDLLCNLGPQVVATLA